jgi:hypothetical protein
MAETFQRYRGQDRGLCCCGGDKGIRGCIECGCCEGSCRYRGAKGLRTMNCTE